MPKAIATAPPLPKEQIGVGGAIVTVTKARVVRDQWTSIGTLKLGLGLEVDFNGDEYSQLFSLDGEVITGSAGRLLVAVGMTDFDAKIKDEEVQVFVGKQFKVMNRGGKLYWYAPQE